MQDTYDQNQTQQPSIATSPAEHALERISNLLACINELTLDTALGDGGKHSAWAAHHLGDMAKSISDGTLTEIARTRGIVD